MKCVDVYKQVGLNGSGSRQNNADGLYCLGISNDVSMLIYYYYFCTDYNIFRIDAYCFILDRGI